MRNLFLLSVIIILLSTIALLMAAQAASAQSDCKTIAADKERPTCYDKGAGAIAEQVKAASAAPIDKTLDARRAYARQLEKWFLSKGISMDVFTKEELSDFDKQNGLEKYNTYPQLVFFGYLSKATVFHIAGKLLKYAEALGFKGVNFHTVGDGRYFYDLSKGVPRCDQTYRNCL